MSLSAKTKKWLKENCAASLKGRTVVITGANSGIGFKTAETAVWLGADVIMACRDTEKASSAASALMREYPESSVTVMKLDLADLSSVEKFAEDIRAKAVDIDAFENNAGVFHQPGRKTADGLELVIGTNYIGVYYLSEKLLPYLETLGHEVRYINTISISYRHADVVYDDFYCEKSYRNMKVYARSKLCLAIYTLALAERYENTDIKIFMSHPGMSPTPLGLNTVPRWLRRPADLFIPLFNTPEKSSLSFSYIMSHDLPSGSLVGPAAVFGGWGYPEVNRISGRAKEGSGELISFTEKEIRRVRRS